MIGNHDPRDPDPYLVDTITRAHRVLNQFAGDGTCSLCDIARRSNMHPADLGHLLPCAFLAPDIIAANWGDPQPADLTARRLKRAWNLLVDWAEQRRLLGFGE